MTITGLELREGEYPFTANDFAFLSGLAKREYGLHLEPAKKSLVYSRLARRVRARGLSSFADYCRLLESERDTDEERSRMLSALTTNVTHFFREAHHFEVLTAVVLPSLVARARSGGRVRLWSAGCSTGPEPYSIAATVLSLCPEAARLDVRVLATDVDPEVLQTAEAGRFPEDEIGSLATSRRAMLFEPGGTGEARIRADVRRLVTFRALNLISDWPMTGSFDAIFCRNVAIYFDRPTQERLWQRFGERLQPGAFLFVGHSERLSGPAAASFASAGVTVYRRTGGSAAKPRGNEWD